MQTAVRTRWTAPAVGVVGSFVVVTLARFPQDDFRYMWTVARTILQGGDPYQPLNRLDPTLVRAPYIHPRLPGGHLLELPLGLIPEAVVLWAGRVFVVGTAVVCAYVLSRIGTVPFDRLLTFMPAFFVLMPGVALANTGNSDLLIAAAVGWALIGSGVPLGFAAALKLWPAVVVPALWVIGRRRQAIEAAFGFVIANLAGLLLPNLTVGETVDAFEAGTPFTGTPWNGSLARWLPLWVMPILGVAFLTVVGRLRRPYDTAIAVGLLISPSTWPAHVSALLIPVLRYRIWPILAIWALWPFFDPNLGVAIAGSLVIGGVLLQREQDRQGSSGLVPE